MGDRGLLRTKDDHHDCIMMFHSHRLAVSQKTGDEAMPTTVRSTGYLYYSESSTDNSSKRVSDTNISLVFPLHRQHTTHIVVESAETLGGEDDDFLPVQEKLHDIPPVVLITHFFFLHFLAISYKVFHQGLRIHLATTVDTVAG